VELRMIVKCKSCSIEFTVNDNKVENRLFLFECPECSSQNIIDNRIVKSDGNQDKTDVSHGQAETENASVDLHESTDKVQAESETINIKAADKQLAEKEEVNTLTDQKQQTESEKVIDITDDNPLVHPRSF